MGRFRDLWASGRFIIPKFDDATVQQPEIEQLFDDLPTEVAVSDQTKEIFSTLKAKRGQETGRWLREMAPIEAVQSATALADNESSGVTDKALTLMNSLFELFVDLAYDFNKTAVGSDLLISVALPMVSEKTLNDEGRASAKKTFQARLTTQQWSLIFSGRDEKVSVLLLPAGMLLAFTIGQIASREYPAFMEMLHPDGSRDWTIGGESFPPAAYPHLASLLLGDLIRVSSGVMSESEIFSRSTGKPILGENLAVGYKQHETQPKLASMVKPQANPQDMSIEEACDIVDLTVDCQLTRLYAEAAKLKALSPSSASLRKQISATETLRTKILEVFEQYALAIQPIDQIKPRVAPPELLV